MQSNTFFALFCVMSVGMNAFVSGVPVRPRPRFAIAGKHQRASALSKSGDNLLETFRNTKEVIVPRDYLADLIWYLLGLTVGAFLHIVNSSLQQVTNNLNNGQYRLEDAIPNVDAATQQELRSIIENAFTEAKNIIDVIIGKLGRVLPSLTSTRNATTRMDPNDIIYMILGMTLEEFLKEITSILERSDTLLVNTITSLTQIVNRVSPSVAELLRSTLTDLSRARDSIRPVLNNLWDVLPDDLTKLN